MKRIVLNDRDEKIIEFLKSFESLKFFSNERVYCTSIT